MNNERTMNQPLPQMVTSYTTSWDPLFSSYMILTNMGSRPMHLYVDVSSRLHVFVGPFVMI